jgi:hypothetical protein
MSYLPLSLEKRMNQLSSGKGLGKKKSQEDPLPVPDLVVGAEWVRWTKPNQEGSSDNQESVQDKKVLKHPPPRTSSKKEGHK